MNRQVMKPFRAPRKRKEKASPTRQSPRRPGKQDKQMQDSEEPTELGLVWKPWIIKETQYSDMEDMIDNGKHDENDKGKRFSIAARAEPFQDQQKEPANSSNVASPSCSEFEAFLEKASSATLAPKKISQTDAYWDNVLEGEKRRLGAANEARMISVADIMLGDESDDDNVPIVATLAPRNGNAVVHADTATAKNNLSLLVEVATTTQASPAMKKKKQPKVFISKPHIYFLSLTASLCK
jgi:hypothetical protein